MVSTKGLPVDWDIGDELPDGETVVDLRRRLVDAAKPNGKGVEFPDANKKRAREAAAVVADKYIKKDGTPATKAETKKAKAALEKSLEQIKEKVAADLAAKGAEIDGAALLDTVPSFLERFVSYPSRHASVAHALWIAHTHMTDIRDSTPRLAFMSPERGSGKTRALEATEFLVPRPDRPTVDRATLSAVQL